MTTVLIKTVMPNPDRWARAAYVLERSPNGFVERKATPDEIKTMSAADQEIVRGAVLTDATKLSASEQLREAGVMLAVFALTFPLFFELAHWLRG